MQDDSQDPSNSSTPFRIRRNETRFFSSLSVPRALNTVLGGKSLPRLPSIMEQLGDSPEVVVDTELPLLLMLLKNNLLKKLFLKARLLVLLLLILPIT
ncbi:hypothetical protein GEMRC1_002639 [Eukaryota sp. GEM-RC1]